MSDAYMVANLVEKMNNPDNDFRYMALDDLMKELQKESFQMDPAIQGKVVRAVLKLMQDKNSEVRSLASKCLGPLVKRIDENCLYEVLKILCTCAFEEKDEELRDDASMDLKTVILEVHQNKGKTVCAKTIPSLLPALALENEKIKIDALDILSKVLERFGEKIPVEKQAEIQKSLLPLLSDKYAGARKGAINAIGFLVEHINDALFDDLFTYLLDALQRIESEEKSEFSKERLRTLVQCTSVLSRYSAVRLDKHLPQLVPNIIKHCSKDEEDDDLRETYFKALESFILSCPTEIASFVSQITDLSLKYIKYDPNFVEFEEDEDENMDEDKDKGDGSDDDAFDDDEFDDDEFDDDKFDDDDDISWKVRSSAAKVLTAVIETRPDLLQLLYKTVAPVLITRFKEREDTVFEYILKAFIALLKQTRDSLTSEDNSDVAPTKTTLRSMEITDGPRQLLQPQVSGLCKALAKRLISEPAQTCKIGFQLLHELVVVLHGGLNDEITLFVPVIGLFLSNSATGQQPTNSSFNLKIEILDFLRLYFQNHSADLIHPHLESLSPLVIESLSDKSSKVVSETLLVCIELIKAIRPVYFNSNTNAYEPSTAGPDHIKYLVEICDVTLRMLHTNDADQEVKEKSIMCLGTLLAQTSAGDLSIVQQENCWNILLERLRNEVTRLITIKTLTAVFRSPIVASKESERCILAAVDDITPLLKKNDPLLLIASLECLIVLVDRLGEQISSESFANLLKVLKPLISDNDLHVLPLTLKTVDSILQARYESVNNAEKDIWPSILQLIKSPLVQGASLENLLGMLATFTKACPGNYEARYDELVDPYLSAGTYDSSDGIVAVVANKHAASTAAQCAAVMTANTSKLHIEKIEKLQSIIREATENNSILYFSLLTIGEIGRIVDLSSFRNLDEEISRLFSAKSDEVKSAAAFALGNICVGNLGKYLPLLVKRIKGEKKPFLLFQALMEVITCYDQLPKDSLKSNTKEIWELLIETVNKHEEETTLRSVVAECLGKLTLTNPEDLLPKLEGYLDSEFAFFKATVVTAIKYAIVDPTQSTDIYLKPIMKKIVELLKDSDLNVRRFSLLTINSAIYRKPHLIHDILPELIPLLYGETIVRDELITIIQMGVFKHKDDKGLEIRKAAYECMYALVSNSLEENYISGFLDHVQIGLDDQEEIKKFVYLMLIRLGKVAPKAVSERLDDFITPFNTVLDFKLGSRAVKQEVEKAQEITKATLRCIIALTRLPNMEISPKFEQFVAEVRDQKMADQYKQTVTEIESRENRSGDYMDLS